MKKMLLLVVALILVVSCSKDKGESAKPINQIQEENGIPVYVESVKKSDMSVWKDYSGVLEGKDQVVVYGMLGDKLQSIKAEIGDFVKKDQVLALFGSENPQAQNHQAKIALETLEKSYKRMLEIHKSGGVSKQQLDEVEAKYLVAKENYATTNLLLSVKAPIDGVITDKYVDLGQIIDTKTPLFKIASTNQLVAKIFVDEGQINSVKAKNVAKIVWDSNGKEEFSGEVSKVSLSAIPERRGFMTEVSVKDPKKILKPGMFVTVNLEVLNVKDVISVNRNSLITSGGKFFVYVIQNGLAVKKEVSLGRNIGFNVEIISGLTESEELVIEGQNLLNEGSKVKVVKK